MTLHIKKFLDKMSLMEGKQTKDVTLSIMDARGLRDDIVKLLTDLYELNKQKASIDAGNIQIEIKGGSFK